MYLVICTAITMLIVAEFTEREGNEMSKNNKPVRERVGRKYLLALLPAQQ